MFKSLFIALLGVVSCYAKTIVLNNNNFVSLVGPVTTNSVDDVIKSLNSLNIIETINEQKSINIYINSPGGSVFAGNHLVQYIKTLQSSNITVNCIAQNFMSMGFVIMQSCSKRYVMFDSVGMQHQMSLGLKGNIENLRNHFQLIDMEIQKIGITKDEYLSKIVNDWWIYGAENIKDGIADELINVRCSPIIMNEKIKKTESYNGYSFQIEMSKCPIINEVKIIEKSVKLNNFTNFNIFYDFENYPINVKEIIDYFKN